MRASPSVRKQRLYQRKGQVVLDGSAEMKMRAMRTSRIITAAAPATSAGVLSILRKKAFKTTEKRWL